MCGVYGGVSLSLNTQLTLLTKFPHFRFCTWIAIIRILLQFIFALLTVFYCGLLNIFQFPAVIVGRGVQWDSRSVLIPRKKIIQDSFDKKVNKGESCYKISNRHRKRKKNYIWWNNVLKRLINEYAWKLLTTYTLELLRALSPPKNGRSHDRQGFFFQFFSWKSWII